ncbi:enoyl-CoA hydratase/isomerase family protein [Luminiphilus syltensis NOR5-1B]|uniref:Enoyl-CoA hydratase domain-containing protein 3, mitochondrial n=1 Tax=Luminiphilus syltensis NOR5-1B TaxID=565045 RepID=B8KXJ1_9GAMM|nr:enoyl-CoA hydratase [Luminiphilus syltensis]EED36854.1 enoyl-CoA hydratase/isomerase family protein [Luminiphilus syltensis NOR5-1B]
MKNAASAYVNERTENNVRWITLNRPDQRNALSLAMIEALTEALEAAAEDSQVRAVVIAAEGSAFSAGHDLREMKRLSDESVDSQQERVREILERCSSLMLSIVYSSKAIIASVQGIATAAGCQLVSACDLAIAADTARFATPGVHIGAFCTTPLVGVGRNIHRKHAMALALTGDAISAEDAVRFGLINEAVAAADLHGQTSALAERIASRSAQGIRQGKADFYRQIDMPIEQAFAYANEAMLRAMTSDEAEEGKAAFFEKRPPQWGEA